MNITVTKQHLRTAGRVADAPRPAESAPIAPWPNGSGVFMHLPEGGRAEVGRVVRDGEKWRLWWKSGEGYRPRGTAPTQSAAILALLDLASKPAGTAAARALAGAAADRRGAALPGGEPVAKAARPRAAALAASGARLSLRRGARA